MTEQSIFNFADILEPISETTPSGTDLRANKNAGSAYHILKDLRDDVRAIERDPEKYSAKIDTVASTWNKIHHYSINILIKESKNLEVVAWLIEASARINGLQGLNEGFSLAHKLCEKFWGTIYPLSEGGVDYSLRISPFTGLDGNTREGTLFIAFNNLTIISAEYNLSGKEFKLNEYQKAIANKDTDLIEEINVTANNTKKEFFQEQLLLAEETLTTFINFNNFLIERVGEENAPISSGIKHQIEQYILVLKNISKIDESNKKKLQQPIIGQKKVAKEKETLFLSNKLPEKMTREIALNLIAELSEYFAVCEPHSPISYLLKRAVKWGWMPFAELLPEIVKDESALKNTRELTGINSINEVLKHD